MATIISYMFALLALGSIASAADVIFVAGIYSHGASAPAKLYPFDEANWLEDDLA
jgi:hypothetical protein